MPTLSVTMASTAQDPRDDGNHRSAQRGARRLPLRNKWNAAVDTGFVAVPNVLLIQFHKLNVTPTEFVVLLNLLAHWWSAETRAFPRVSTIARRMDTSPRTIQRALNRLRALGLVEWQRIQVRDGKVVPNGRPGAGVRRRMYDLAPLVALAGRLAEDRIGLLANQAERGRHTEIAA
jgi:Helix-turn-helix domain